MLYQYQCACCNKAVTANDRECLHCGSQHIRSPYRIWILCVLACLAVVVTVKIMHIYVKNHSEAPHQMSLVEVLNKENLRSESK